MGRNKKKENIKYLAVLDDYDSKQNTNNSNTDDDFITAKSKRANQTNKHIEKNKQHLVKNKEKDENNSVSKSENIDTNLDSDYYQDDDKLLYIYNFLNYNYNKINRFIPVEDLYVRAINQVKVNLMKSF